MQFNIDIAIFIGFLMINLAVSLFYSRSVANIHEYPIGKRNFSNRTIVATLIATWIASNSLTIKVSEKYNQGLYFIAANLAAPFCLMIVGYFFTPRIAEFFSKISVTERIVS